MSSRRPPPGESSIFLIDANNFLFRAYHALPMLNAPDGRPVNAVHGFVRMVQALRREHAPRFIVAVFDGGGKGLRHEIYPEYKANRPPPPEDLVPQMALVREAIDALAIQRVQSDGVEADDLIAAYADKAREAGTSVVVVSSDKDLMQLVDDSDPQVVLLDTMKSITVGPEEVVAKFGVGPGALGDLLALAGDSSDNVPGVPGIGPKTAAGLLEEYGDLESVLAAAPNIKQKKRRERLIEHAEDARMSRKLVQLQHGVELPLPLEALEDKGADPERVRQFFEPLGFKAVLRELKVSAAAAEPPPVDPDAEDTRNGEQDIELTPLAGYTVDRERYRTWMAADLDELKAALDGLKPGSRLAFHCITDGAKPLQALVLGVALAADDGEGKEILSPGYLPLQHRGLELGATDQVNPDLARDLLRRVLESEDVAIIADDVKTQSILWGRLGVEVRGVAMDPMLASYALDPARSGHDVAALAHDLMGHDCLPIEKVVGKGRKQVPMDQAPLDSVTTFAAERAELALVVGRHLDLETRRAGKTMTRLVGEVELPLAVVLRRLEERGICLDADVIRAQSEDLAQSIGELRGRIEEEAGYPINPDSPQQLQKLLFEERGLPATKKTKTGYSTDAKVLDELSLLDPIVKDILEYRALTKLKGTYLDPLPGLVNPQTGRLHTRLHQAVAQTGRLSSSDPNLQNIPIRTPVGRRIREAFVAGEGKTLVSVDYSQIELRVLAHLSGDPNLCSAFNDGVDVHRRTASEVFGVDEGEVSDEQRRIAKAVNFGVIYGQTAFGLAQQLGIPRGKAGSYIRAYFEKIPGVDRYMTELVTLAKRKGYAETVLGRKRRIPELRRKGPARAHGERMARNTPIQGSAADILKLAMIDVEAKLREKDWGEMILTVHDELIFECREDRVSDVIELVRPAMESAFELRVPLSVDAGQGRTWADCKA